MRTFHIRILVLALFVAASNNVVAAAVPHLHCFERASNYYRIDVKLLVAIAKIESNFDMAATNMNRNGTQDFGIMMINSHWKPKLEALGIDWGEVTTSRCLNIHVGAWVLAQNFAQVGVNWYAVGAYNAGFGMSDRSRKNRLRYALKVHDSLTEIEEFFPHGNGGNIAGFSHPPLLTASN